MPLVTIDRSQGRPSSELDAISESIQEAMVEHLNVPPRDRFQIITEHSPATLRFDRDYLEIDRDDGFVLVRVTLAEGAPPTPNVPSIAASPTSSPSGSTSGRTTSRWSWSRTDAPTGRSEVAAPSYFELPPEEWR
jgi:phenylpyruvate tautomerase PptA (4-oxalocrotonate tautomerase family)